MAVFVPVVVVSSSSVLFRCHHRCLSPSLSTCVCLQLCCARVFLLFLYFCCLWRFVSLLFFWSLTQTKVRERVSLFFFFKNTRRKTISYSLLQIRKKKKRKTRRSHVFFWRSDDASEEEKNRSERLVGRDCQQRRRLFRAHFAEIESN